MGFAGYYWANTRLAYLSFYPGLTLGLTVTNLFDRDAREPSNSVIPNDYPQPGRQWWVPLKYDF